MKDIYGNVNSIIAKITKKNNFTPTDSIDRLTTCEVDKNMRALTHSS